MKINRPRVRKWLLVGAMLALPIGLLVYLSFSDLIAALSGSATHNSCSSVAALSRERDIGSAGPTAGKVTAKLQPGQREEVDFGRSMTARTLTLYFSLSTVPSGPAYFHVRTGAFVRADDARLSSSAQNIVASAKGVESTLILNVCFNRGNSPETYLGDPGSYAGSVTVDDGRLSALVTVPITVTMQYPSGVFLLWLYFGAIIPGSWCLWVIKGERDGDESALGLEFLKWVITVDGVVAVVAGGFAAFAVYIAVYLRDPTWGSSALQPLTLYGGMFSAFVTTAGIASLTGRGSRARTPAPASRPGRNPRRPDRRTGRRAGTGQRSRP
jgi:hypothetical protein